MNLKVEVSEEYPKVSLQQSSSKSIGNNSSKSNGTMSGLSDIVDIDEINYYPLSRMNSASHEEFKLNDDIIDYELSDNSNNNDQNHMELNNSQEMSLPLYDQNIGEEESFSESNNIYSGILK